MRDIAWVWLGSPTSRYAHAALGSRQHAASLHVLPNLAHAQLLTYSLPLHRVIEDRIPRLVDLDGDGRDEIILVEADASYGAALVVYGLRNGAIAELARGPHVGTTTRWLNPLGVADFDGDGILDLASVTTPHIGGVLTLHHYRPPRLEPYARATDVTNHRLGELEQQLAVIAPQAGQWPAILIPDMQLTALRVLRWDSPGQWTELARPLVLPARVERFTPLDGGGCLKLTDGSWWRVTLAP
ncbi:MAG: VCBS repeat-containing protein [Comamonadaceae bacterium]|nr:VCBS repeat-containing protein [Comamonadaceae bacterium]